MRQTAGPGSLGVWAAYCSVQPVAQKFSLFFILFFDLAPGIVKSHRDRLSPSLETVSTLSSLSHIHPPCPDWAGLGWLRMEMGDWQMETLEQVGGGGSLP